MKPTAAIGKATRTLGKLFFALMLLLIAVAVGFGGTALFVYHQFSNGRPAADRTAQGAPAERRTTARSSQDAASDSSQTRRVAAMPSDQSQYTYADNSGGRPSAPARKQTSVTNVPAPLVTADQSTDSAEAAARLNDPESHYIVDARTGRVVGIDGTAGARREAEEERLQQSNEPPRAIVTQTPPPEVRVASPVIEDGRPVYRGAQVPSVNATASQFPPVRRALPVTPDESGSTPHVFNAAEYMVSDQERPVLRAQAVVPPGARVVKTVRVYRLPDGSQTVAAD